MQWTTDEQDRCLGSYGDELVAAGLQPCTSHALAMGLITERA
jgi:hypothetical protein